jgi:acetylcholinesterase/cholinesterase
MIGINHDEGNFWNIYNLPKFFDVPEQPLLTLDNFNECVQTAFSRLSEMVKDAASYVYLGERCDYITGKSKFLAEQINQAVGDFYLREPFSAQTTFFCIKNNNLQVIFLTQKKYCLC